MDRSSSVFIKTSGNPLGHTILNLAAVQYGIIMIPSHGIRALATNIADVEADLKICVERGWINGDAAQATSEDIKAQGLVADKAALYQAIAVAAGRIDVSDMGGLKFSLPEDCDCGLNHGAVFKSVRGHEVEVLECVTLEDSLVSLEVNVGPETLTTPQALKLFADMVTAKVPIDGEALGQNLGQQFGDLLASLLRGRGVTAREVRSGGRRSRCG